MNKVPCSIHPIHPPTLHPEVLDLDGDGAHGGPRQDHDLQVRRLPAHGRAEHDAVVGDAEVQRAAGDDAGGLHEGGPLAEGEANNVEGLNARGLELRERLQERRLHLLREQGLVVDPDLGHAVG